MGEEEKEGLSASGQNVHYLRQTHYPIFAPLWNIVQRKDKVKSIMEQIIWDIIMTVLDTAANTVDATVVKQFHKISY